MKDKSRFMTMEELIVRDDNLLFTTVSYIVILLIFINLILFFSPAIGTIASIIYLLINGAFLGHAFFEKEDLFLRFILGNLLLVTFLALIAWVVMTIYNLDIIRSTLVLCIVTTLASLLNKRKPRKK